MLIKRMMLVAILATVTNATFGLDMGFVNTAAGEYGPQNNAITEAALNKVLEECRKVTDWNDVGQLPLSSILRAQLSNDTTSAQLGNSEAFRRLFPVNGAEIAAEFKKLVAADSTQASRNAAIDKIAELKAAAASAPVVVIPAEIAVSAGSGINLETPENMAWLRGELIKSGTDLSGDIGRDVNVVNPNDGATPLMVAASQGMPGMVEFLLANGADKNARFTDGRTALELIADRNARGNEPWYDTIKVLLS